MSDRQTALLVIGLWAAACLLYMTAQVLYYRSRRYPCPACGGRGLRFLVQRSSPYLRVNSFPGPVRVHRYACDQCPAQFCETNGEWEREDEGREGVGDRPGRE
jgi:hypothetical protein